jgi:hypothetical protein
LQRHDESVKVSKKSGSIFQKVASIADPHAKNLLGALYNPSVVTMSFKCPSHHHHSFFAPSFFGETKSTRLPMYCLPVGSLVSAELTSTCNAASNASTAAPPQTASIRRACSRKNRVYVFYEFLRQTYGDYLQDGVILDVAGGKGTLSWLLCNAIGCESVVLDPCTPGTQRSLLQSIGFLQAHPEEALLRAMPGRDSYQPLAALLPLLLQRQGSWIVPRHVRIPVNDTLVQAVRRRTLSSTDISAGWTQYCQEALIPSSMPTDGIVHDLAEDIWNLLLRTKLIVGFHPDQATEAILDFAGLLQVPYCLVPCCVFPSQFPQRTLKRSRLASDETDRTSENEKRVPVKNYADLIEYLLQKAQQPSQMPQCVDHLAFHATTTSRNLVLYTLPTAFSTH